MMKLDPTGLYWGCQPPARPLHLLPNPLHLSDHVSRDDVTDAMLPPLRLLTLLLSLPRQGDGTPHHHHDEDDQGLLEARLFQVTAGGNIRGGKKKL